MNVVIATGKVEKVGPIGRTGVKFTLIDKVKRGDKHYTTYIPVVQWTADRIPDDGDTVFIEGRWSVHSYTDQNGNKRNMTQCVVDEGKLYIIGVDENEPRVTREGEQLEMQTQAQAAAETPPEDDDNIPFIHCAPGSTGLGIRIPGTAKWMRL